MLGFDLLLANWDRTVQSRNLLRAPSGQLWWIDHGSCRFLHHLRSRRVPVLPSTHFLFDAEDRPEPRRLPMLGASCIRDVIAEVPEEWLEAAGRDRAGLATDLIEYLRRQLGPSA